MDLPETLNLEYLESLYQQWQADADSVSETWRIFFKGFQIGFSRPASDGECTPAAQSRVDELIHRYRDLGHLLACMDPLSACPMSHPLLEPAVFGLTDDDMDVGFDTTQLAGLETGSLRDIIAMLKQTYCRSIGVEFMHVQDPDERAWLQRQMEPMRNQPRLDADRQQHILRRLCQATLFEQFLNRKYVGVTRFSIEGGEALIALLDTLAETLSETGCNEIILGMAHRGRLNVQAHFLGRPYEEIISEFESCYDPDQLVGAGDVKYHNGYLSDTTLANGQSMRIYLCSNPSHLEAVNPVVEGLARARQDNMGDGGAAAVAPLLIHGDAAFAGQGIVAETLNLSQLAGYKTGGSIHVIINNQIGYTTLPEDARSTRYATDVAKMLMVPVFHVHGENPEAVAHVADLAARYRQRYNKDVVIDLVCFRRFGHNEGDEPYFTQPLMYERIRQRPPLYQVYADQLAPSDAEMPALKLLEDQINQQLDTAFEEIHGSACPFPAETFYNVWQGRHGTFDPDAVIDTVEPGLLQSLSAKLNQAPEGFAMHAKLAMIISRRAQAVADGEGIDWAGAESLAFASLVAAGTPVRLSGQDCARGTFSQRHCTWFDKDTGQSLTPLNTLGDGQAPFQVYNSLLAEAAVIGFEYGYSLVRPETLVMWEAQFGDFANTAQSIIDLFVAAGYAKWQRPSGLALLLPHGWEGLGPEHSSARLERFLQLCADDNLQVCNPSTPAQYFHLLRRQALAPFRIPLVVMTPKSLLRHPQAVSSLDDLANGAFQAVIDDAGAQERVKKVILCSGKIYYELLARRNKVKDDQTAIVRIEQFYPYPQAVLASVLDHYRDASQWLWVQEEPENMGAWMFLRYRLQDVIGQPLRYVGRPAAASPATGFPAIYRQQQAAVAQAAIGVEGDEK